MKESTVPLTLLLLVLKWLCLTKYFNTQIWMLCYCLYCSNFKDNLILFFLSNILNLKVVLGKSWYCFQQEIVMYPISSGQFFSRKIHLTCENGCHRWREWKRKKYHHRNAKVVVFIKEINLSHGESSLEVINVRCYQQYLVSVSKNVNTVKLYFTLFSTFWYFVMAV